MILSKIFQKPVDRPIEGVIKADDEKSLWLEVEEYVITNEISKQLNGFLKAYNKYSGANGVWISGFFGSGKSHLLKMMALLLENKTINNQRVFDIFATKLKEDAFLLADLKLAVEIPSKSILFNIDQKADVISKKQIDALLAVFVKVFDEMCGYYGKQGHIAKFERDMAKRGHLESFKNAFKEIAGMDWAKGREQALLEAPNIASAYAKATGAAKESATRILDKYREEYKVSIEDFAQEVKAYIDQQPNNFRLNFFVDEVGQYVAENVKLMTNLQTIAESLATKCNGRAWVIVTAQEEMDSVIGEMTKQQGNDFTKIQARFANRVKLNSQDVAEVIQKRLLLKNKDGVDQLTKVYQEQSNNFQTLFNFRDGAQTYKNFTNREHFIQCYPFIPYQFHLFQTSIQELSKQNAFEGKHSSVGERSMLGVFQDVAKQISNQEVGWLATFDLMFEGIRKSLKAQNQQAILNAENNLHNDFAIQILKTLLLVKYVKSFKATVINLVVLAQSSFTQDAKTLKKNVEEALNLLEQQTYIQRNGDEYEYLTNEEKDVEQEIKNTSYDHSDMLDELSKLTFEAIIKDRKIVYVDNNQAYSFTKKIDDKLFGREFELTVHIISPFHQHAGSEEFFRVHSGNRSELFILMPSDERISFELSMFKRTEKYINQNISTKQKDGVMTILANKRTQNMQRMDKIKTRIEELIGKSKMIVLGNDIETGIENPRERIVYGFQGLVKRVYTNLKMLRSHTYTEDLIPKFLNDNQILMGGDEQNLSEAETEILNFLQNNKKTGKRTTLFSLVENFEKRPFGWYLAAIQCTVAKLIARGNVEIKANATSLEGAAQMDALVKVKGHENIILEPQIEFSSSEVKELKKFFVDFFDTPPKSNEAKAMGLETSDAFKALCQKLEDFDKFASQYSFLKDLKAPLVLCKTNSGKDYAWYLKEIRGQEEQLFNAKEKYIDPILKFMGGNQKEIYDEAKKFLLEEKNNLENLKSEETTRLKAIIEDPHCYRSNSNSMKDAKQLTDSLKSQIAALVKAEKSKAIAVVNSLKEKIATTNEFKNLKPEQLAQIYQPFEELTASVQSQSLVAIMDNKVRTFQDKEFPHLLEKLVAITQTPAMMGVHDAKTPIPPGKSIHGKDIAVHFKQATLNNKEDVAEYVKALEAAYLREVVAGVKIFI